MTRLVIDIDSKGGDLFVVKELVAMMLEPFGNVRVVSVERDRRDVYEPRSKSGRR